MYEYMSGLQAKFFKEPEFPEQEKEISRLYEELKQSLDKEYRGKLLKLMDLTGDLHYQITEAGFVAGFRLAAGIAKELSLEEPYSFDRDQEEQAALYFRNEKENLSHKRQWLDNSCPTALL